MLVYNLTLSLEFQSSTQLFLFDAWNVEFGVFFSKMSYNIKKKIEAVEPKSRVFPRTAGGLVARDSSGNLSTLQYHSCRCLGATNRHV